MSTPQARVQILMQEIADFKERLTALPPDAWEQPSACQGWTVADVAAHLAGQDFSLRVSRGLQGNISPPPGAQPVAQHDEDAFAQAIFQRAFVTKAQAGDQLLSTLMQRLDESAAIFAAVPPEQWDALCYWPPGPEPARVMLDMRISELCMHAWDICSRFDPDYRLSNAAVPVLMDTVPRAVRRAFRPDPSLTSPLRFRFLIDSPPAAYDLVFTAAGATLETVHPDPTAGHAAPQPAVTYHCRGETWVMLLYGRQTPDAASNAGQLTYSGNAQLAQTLTARFVGG